MDRATRRSRARRRRDPAVPDGVGRGAARLIAGMLALAAALGSAGPTRAQQDTLRLSLRQAVEVAGQHHLGLRSARLTAQIQQRGVAREEARFGRSVSANLSQQSTRSPSVSRLEQVQTSSNSSQSLGMSLSQSLATGGSIGLDFRNTRSANNAAFNLLNPQYQSGLTLRWSQPLLQGRGGVNRIGLEQARNTLSATQVTVEGQTWDLESQVGQAYWALVLARQSLAVRQQLMAGAERVLESVRVRAEVGAAARSSILEAQVGVAQRQQEIVAARGGLRQAEDQLRSLLGLDQEPEGWRVGLVPTDDPKVAPFAGTAEEGVRKALERDPSCRRAALDLKSGELQLALARDQARASVSLTAQAGLTGIGGSYGDNLDVIKDAKARSWQGGLGLSMPLGRSPAAESVHQAELQQQQRQVLLEQARLQLAEQVRAQHRQVEVSRQREEAASWTEKLAAQSVDEEEERLQLGLSTVRQVLDAQDALAQSRLTRLQALVDCNDALLEWHRLTGE